MNILTKLAAHLRTRKKHIIKTIEVDYQAFDPTHGPQTATATIETVDFDKLIDEIDEFAATFEETPLPPSPPPLPARPQVRVKG